MKSIRFKLWAGMMALVMVVLILLWLFQIVFLESFYTNMRINDIKKQATSMSQLLVSGNNAEFESKFETFAFNNNLSISLEDKAGKTVYSASYTNMGGQMSMMKNSTRIEDFQEALQGKESMVSWTHPRFGNKFMMIALPVSIQGGLPGVMLITMPLADVEDTVAILKIQLVYISLILLAAALLISFLISRSFTRPILEIKKASEIMAGGDFSVHITTKKKDEIGELAESINDMGKQLSKIEQLRKDFVANVSHELRTPLSLIRGYAETIRDVTGNSPEKREKQLGIIIEETERLGGIVDDILNLSQLQSGHLKIDKTIFKIDGLIDTIIKRYDLLSEKTGVEIKSVGTSDVLVEADELRIGQVLYNLINNGFNHTPEGGLITIRIVDKNEGIRIEVSDTGKGISEEELPYIWERYYQTEKTSNKRTTGTGLGLAIVKGVIEAHQTEFGVQSQKGVGTTFWFEVNKAAK